MRGDFGGICQSRQSGHGSGGIHRNLCQLPASWQQGTVTQTPAALHFRVERTTVCLFFNWCMCSFLHVSLFSHPTSDMCRDGRLRGRNAGPEQIQHFLSGLF